MERVYRPVGRPTGKGGRVDVLVRHPASQGAGAFLFTECKTKDSFDADLKHLEGQLFRLSLQEQPPPLWWLALGGRGQEFTRVPAAAGSRLSETLPT